MAGLTLRASGYRYGFCIGEGACAHDADDKLVP